MDININMERTLAYASRQRLQSGVNEQGQQASLLQKQSAMVGTVDLSIEIKDGDRSLKLVYQATYAALSESSELRMGPSEQLPYGEEDFSPEATAQRIVDLATGLFERFKEHSQKADALSLLDRFMETIDKGIRQGFDEAREILQGMGALSEEVAGGIDHTFDLVQAGLQDFLHRMQLPTAELPLLEEFDQA